MKNDPVIIERTLSFYGMGMQIIEENLSSYSPSAVEEVRKVRSYSMTQAFEGQQSEDWAEIKWVRDGNCLTLSHRSLHPDTSKYSIHGAIGRIAFDRSVGFDTRMTSITNLIQMPTSQIFLNEGEAYLVVILLYDPN